MEGSEDAYVGYMTIRVRISNFSRACNNFILMPEQLIKYYISVLSFSVQPWWQICSAPQCTPLLRDYRELQSNYRSLYYSKYLYGLVGFLLFEINTKLTRAHGISTQIDYDHYWHVLLFDAGVLIQVCKPYLPWNGIITVTSLCPRPLW